MESRLKQIRNELGLTQEQMAKKLGCSKANISMIETGKSFLTEKNEMILVKLLNINPGFISSGRGPVRQPEPLNRCGGTTPLFDLRQSDGLHELFEPGTAVVPEGYISIPDMPRCDGAVYYIGDTMYPILRSGDMVMFSRLADISEIFWGDMHLVAVETSAGERVRVCYIDKSNVEGRIVLRGADPSIAPTEIEVSKIRGIGFVKATIRLNSVK